MSRESEKPFKINKSRVKKSIFKTVDEVEKCIKAYYRDESIGFSRISSLKSMGLIPRSNGYYKLGPKYVKKK